MKTKIINHPSFTKVTESQVRYYIARFSLYLRLDHCYFYENFGKRGTKYLALDGEMWNSSKCIFFLTSFYWYAMHCISFPELLFFDSQKVWALSLGTRSFTLLTSKIYNFITFICLFHLSNYCSNPTFFFSFPFFCYRFSSLSLTPHFRKAWSLVGSTAQQFNT